jgi:putative component of membrane protein insertase Oxa1/YidC/SpoIIIJ protein YidD
MGFCASAQLVSSDLERLQEKDFYRPEDLAHYTGSHNNGQFLEVKEKSWLARYNPVSLGMGAVMYSYQHVVSPLLSRSCPYEITCSNFAKMSIREWGAFKGVFISADRVLRCNRLSLLNVSPLNIAPRTGKILDEPAWYR